MSDTVYAKCREWNAITGEDTLTCKETSLGHLRIWCAGRRHQMTVHYNSWKRLIVVRNTARPEHEKDTELVITGYPIESGRGARLMRNGQPIDLDMLIIGHLRVLAGLSRE